MSVWSILSKFTELFLCLGKKANEHFYNSYYTPCKSAWRKCKGLAGQWWHSTDATAVGSMLLAEPCVEFFWSWRQIFSAGSWLPDLIYITVRMSNCIKVVKLNCVSFVLCLGFFLFGWFCLFVFSLKWGWMVSVSIG